MYEAYKMAAASSKACKQVSRDTTANSSTLNCLSSTLNSSKTEFMLIGSRRKVRYLRYLP